MSAVARAWRPLEYAATAAAAGAGAGAPFTVVTYNLLADTYATTGLHSYCAPELLAWAHRGPRLLAELLSYGADVLCCQEVERPWFDAVLRPALAAAGYVAAYSGQPPPQPRAKAAPPRGGPDVGVVLAHRAARFDRLGEHVAVRFSLAAGASTAAAAAEISARGDDRAGVLSATAFWGDVAKFGGDAVLAALADRAAGGRPLLAAATHLYWDPRRPDVKAGQAHLLCDALTRLAAERGLMAGGGDGPHPPGGAPPPVVLGGDLNSLPWKAAADQFDRDVPPGGLVSGVCELLASGRLPPGHPHHPAARTANGRGRGYGHPTLAAVELTSGGLGPLCSACAAAPRGEPPATTATDKFCGTLDYVWHSAGALAPTAVLEMPFGWPGGGGDAQGGCPLPPLPNAEWPSDHLAVGARLAWAPSGA